MTDTPGTPAKAEEPDTPPEPKGPGPADAIVIVATQEDPK
jgi:hypothetical protein